MAPVFSVQPEAASAVMTTISSNISLVCGQQNAGVFFIIPLSVESDRLFTQNLPQQIQSIINNLLAMAGESF